ncbi:hypothetical protein SprV_0301102100 [Sparganum proliferum]
MEVERGEKEDQQKEEQKAGEQKKEQSDEDEDQFYDIELKFPEEVMEEVEEETVFPMCNADNGINETLKSVIVKAEVQVDGLVKVYNVTNEADILPRQDDGVVRAVGHVTDKMVEGT